MNINILLVIAILVVSWVIFIFNFVLGYYIGRIVEAAEHKAQKKKEDNKKKDVFKSYIPSSPFGKPAIS